MLDLSNIPSQQQQTFTFYATGNWQTWSKPRNAKMIEIFCLGGGGGGGSSLLSGSAYGGAGGGGSAGIVKGIIPAFLLPDTLYILVGKGGAGASTPNAQGGTGGISYVGLQPSISEQTLICKSSSQGPTGGASAFSSGSGGLAATLSSAITSAFGNLGLFIAIAGVNGNAGGINTGTAGGSQAALGTNLTTGGAGGGGKSNTVIAGGGNITPASVILTTQVNGGVTAGQNGADGYGTLQPFCGTGGAGGASIFSGIGGRGGNGYYGCGGGGTGSGSLAGSRGGDGGDGLIIITVLC
jgi:hypothetical protein